MNGTFVPIGQTWGVAERVLLPLAALPVLLVWYIIWRLAPRRKFRVNDPYKRMQYAYAMSSGMMCGFFAGHILPNAVLSEEAEHGVTWIAYVLGVCVGVGFFRFTRSCGRATYQVPATTTRDPYILFDDATGEQVEYISSTTTKTVVATNLDVHPAATDDYFTMESDNSTYAASHEGAVEQLILSHQTGDDLGEDVAKVADAADALWIRRKLAWTLYVLYLIYDAVGGFFLMYNRFGTSNGALVACFWLYKMATAVTVSAFFVFGYVHLHPVRFPCCNVRVWYLVCALFSATAVSLSTLPVLLDVTELGVDLMVENPVTSAISGAIAGFITICSARFCLFEVEHTSACAEFKWWVMFIGSALGMTVLGIFL